MRLDISWDFFLTLLGQDRASNWARMRERFGESFAAETFHARCREMLFILLLEDALRLKAGVVEMLDLLDRRSLPRAIATSSLRSSVDHHLASFGLTDRFHVIVANGDYAAGKPHPEPYLVAAAKLGVAPSNCLALEDSYNGVRSAAAAGMMTVMVPDLLPPDEEMEALCVHIAPDLHDVCRHLARQ